MLNDVRVGRALESILSQRHRHEIETIVVDAGSSGRTSEVIEQYRDRITKLIIESDDGIYDGMNKGIRKATGEVVGILNADDQYIDQLVIRDVAEVFAEDEAVDACYGDQIYSNEAGRIVRYWKAGKSSRIKWLLGWMPPHPTFFARRRIYERYGAFDLQYPIAADYELMMRLMFKHGINVKYLERVMLNMATGGNSTKSVMNILKANLEVGRACRNHRLHGMFLVPVLKPARKIPQFTRRPIHT